VQTRPQAPKSHAAVIAVVLIVVAIVVVGVIALVMLAGGGSEARITISVYSTHTLMTVDYEIYIEEKLLDSGTLDPGYYVTLTASYHWPSSDPTTVRVSAAAIGGGFGTQTDYEDVTISDGDLETVTLYI
jgi:hypothetical protein